MSAGNEFSIAELFFSRTDPKGIIRSGNDVFVRVSGYPLDELIGKPHNVVRHPDMPRIAFRLMWEAIEAGAPFAAYVQNRAADGAPYWVMAAVVPVGDGYLSVRLKPTAPQFAAARTLYTELRELEREAEGERGRQRKQAIELSRERLAQALGGLGFDDYGAFMRDALAAEIASRDEHLHGRARAAGGAGLGALGDILASYAAVQEVLDRLFANVSAYVRLNETLRRKSDFVLELAGDMRLYALNALLGSTHLGDEGAALGAVASLMQQRSDAGGGVLREVNEAIDATVALLAELAFSISLSKLQSETAVAFTQELLAGEGEAVAEGRVADDLGALATCVAGAVEGVLDGLHVLDERLSRLTALAGALRLDLDVLRTLQLNGRIEAARVADAAAVLDLFEGIGRRVATARDEIGEFDDLAGAHAGLGESEEQRIRTRLALIGARTAELAQAASAAGDRARVRRPLETITSPATIVAAPVS